MVAKSPRMANVDRQPRQSSGQANPPINPAIPPAPAPLPNPAPTPPGGGGREINVGRRLKKLKFQQNTT